MDLFPCPEPFVDDFLKVSDLHTIHYEQSGNKEGPAVIILHGGPGGGLRPSYRQYFDPKKWHIIQFSQRGCGKSTPFAELRENTTWDLVSDIEKIREHIGIDKWCVFGGSWGSTLALAYAQSHPEKVQGLFLRGIFLLRDREIQWFYQEGASRIFPEAWEGYLKPIPENERGDLLRAFHKRLTSDNESEKLAAAKAWALWEGSTSTLLPNPQKESDYEEDQFALAFARIENHYFINKGFFEGGKALLDNIDRIKDIPGCIIQGRYDVVCPAESAWELHKAWPKAEFKIIDDAGHSVSEKGITQALVEYIDSFKP